MPARGEVWTINLDPVHGQEQGRTRPAIILSNDQFTNGPAGLVVVVPLTTRHRANMPLRVAVKPPDGGLTQLSFALCEMVRSVSTQRLSGAAWGPPISPQVMAAISYRVRALLDL